MSPTIAVVIPLSYPQAKLKALSNDVVFFSSHQIV